MKIVYSGGFNRFDSESVNRSVIVRYKDEITKLVSKGKRVGWVTLAKPDRYYDLLLHPTYGKAVEIIDNQNIQNIDWMAFDVLFLLGGTTLKLHAGLEKSGFRLNKLKKDTLLVGDSAGAFVLAAAYYDCKYPETGEVKFYPGFCPDSKLVIVAHSNNPAYTTERMKEKVTEYAKEKFLSVVTLAENEEYLLSL